MRRAPLPPARIVEGGAPDNDVSRAIRDEIVRTVGDTTQFSNTDRARIRVRLAAATEGRRRPRWRPLVAGIVIFLVGSTVGAAVLERVVIPRLRRHGSPVGVEGVRREAVAVRHPQRAAPAAVAEPPRGGSAGALAPEPTASADAPAPGRHHRPAGKQLPESPAAAPTEAPQPSGGEATSMAGILRLLRHAHNPQAALGALDVHDRSYPDGMLRVEAARARVDALMALGRARDALAVLDGISFQGSMRAAELQTLRGELRAKHGRCSDAMDDFSAVLATGRPDLDERALFGRAGCRARLGDEVGARVDLDAYRALFPEGRFIDQVRRRGAAGE